MAPAPIRAILIPPALLVVADFCRQQNYHQKTKGGGMKGKNLLIALALTILVFVPISSQCDPPKSPNDGRLLDEDTVLGVARSDPDETSSHAEFKSDSLHVAAWLLGGGFIGLVALRRRFKK
jgi:hypothetical protein